MEIGTLVTLLGLGASATDQDITGRASALVGLEGKLREATGKSDPASQLAAIDGWRESAGKLAEVQTQLKLVTDREEAASYAALIKTGEESAQITPANKDKVKAKFPTSSALSAYLETAPSALPGKATAGETAAHKAQGGEAVNAESAPLTFRGKTYKELSFAERAAWLNDKDLGAQGRAAKAEYDRAKGGV